MKDLKEVTMEELKGMCVALATPFSEDGERVDEKNLKIHIDSMLEAGVHIILVCGGTGEFFALRYEERRRIAEVASKHINGRAKFMVKTSALNTADAIEFAKHAEGVGADCLLISPVMDKGPNSDGCYYHYEKISQAIKIPIMAYEIPSQTGFDILPSFFKRLLDIDNVKYIKDSLGSMSRQQQYIAVTKEKGKGKVFNGADTIAWFGLLSGCPGCVWGATNAMPKESVELYNCAVSGRLSEGNELWKRMWPANNFFDTHVYNASVKAATNLTGRKVGPTRKPVLPLKDYEMAELKVALEPLGVK